MAPLARSRRVLESLGFRLTALLTVALLPVGLIAVVQTAEVRAVAREREDLTFLALTERAASRERRGIERAIGVVQGLSVAIPELARDEDRCDSRMRALVRGPYPYAFAGYVPASGVMTCSSVDIVIDFSDDEAFADFAANPRTRVVANSAGAASGEAVVIVSEPVLTEDGAFAGFVSVSIPQGELEVPVLTDAPVALVTFNDSGDVVRASIATVGPPDELLPRGMDLRSLIGRPADVFEGEDGAGRTRVFAVVTIVPGVVYTLGSWDRPSGIAAGFVALPVWTFPLLMWVLSLAVAYFAVHRLVIRHVSMLVRRMRAFARHRTLPPPGDLDAPAELREIEAGLGELTEQVLRDEADAEDRLHEQKVMMKEIHHRVKNNLQLISSIINMQMRQLDAPGTKLVLGRIRDRVLGLATIHRNLYEASDVTGVSADDAIRDIVEQLLRTVGAPDGPGVDLDLDPISLYPDQAVPLALFVTEALTNAFKHGGEGAGTIAVRLRNEGERARLTVENEVGARRAATDWDGAAGLGNRLIKAFATQLEGRVEVEEEEGRYCVGLSFPLEAFAEASAPPGAGSASRRTA